jgi:hypothetical protein
MHQALAESFLKLGATLAYHDIACITQIILSAILAYVKVTRSKQFCPRSILFSLDLVCYIRCDDRARAPSAQTGEG